MESEDRFPGVRFLDRTKRISEFKGDKDVIAVARRGRSLRRNCLPKWAVKSRNHRMGLIILIVVILLLVGAFPTGGYGYGYRSHGILGTILIIILILYLLGRL